MANTTANATPENSASKTEADSTQENAQNSDVKVIDDVCVVSNGDATAGLTGSVVIEKPAAGEAMKVQMAADQKYFFDFHESDVKSFTQQDGNLTLTFADGSSIVLMGYTETTTGEFASTLAFRDDFSLDAIKVVDTTEEKVEEPKEEAKAKDLLEQDVAKVEPAAGDEEAMAKAALEAAEVEPAAGEEAGGAPQNTGFSFSDPDSQAIGPLVDVGPINPTALQYGVDYRNDEVRILEQPPRAPIDVRPELESSEVALDETDIGPGPNSVSGVVVVEFGSDGPGTLGPDGTFSYTGSTLGGNLTSNGVNIIVTPTVDGYIGEAGGVKIFDLVINKDTGQYTFTQYAAIDHNDPNNPNDVIDLKFGVVATDADNDTANTTITVHVADDAPLATAPMVETIDEKDLVNGPIVVNDTLAIDFGNDLPGAVSPNGTSSFGGVAVLSTSGQAITITATANGYVGTFNGGVDKAFEITINPTTGAYTYTQYEPFDHDLNLDTINLVFGVDVVDYDGDKVASTITININDSVPVIPPPPPPPPPENPDPNNPGVGHGYEIVDETNLGPNVVSGNIPVQYGADTPGTLNASGTTSSSVPLLSNGQVVTISVDGSGNYVGTTNGGATTVFTLTIADNGNYTFTQLEPLDHPDGLNPDDNIRVTFGIEAEDSDGDKATGNIIIDIKDDGPSISGASGILNEKDLTPGPAQVNGTLTHDFGNDGAGDISPNGTTSFTGVASLTSGGNAVTISATANGYVGTSAIGDVFTITVNNAGQYVFTLLKPLDHAAGDDPIFLNFGVVITDFDKDTAAANIQIKLVDSTPDIPPPPPPPPPENPDPNNPGVGKGYEIVDETNLGPNVVSGNIPVNYGSDVPGSLNGSGTTSTSTPLFSHGQAVTISVDANGNYVGTINGGATTVFSLTIADNGNYTFTQILPLDHPNGANPDDNIRVTFGIVARDFDGDTATGNIIIDIKDDGPSISGASGMLSESALDPGPAQLSGTLTHDFGNDGAGTIVPSGTTSFTGVASLTSGGNAVTITPTAGGYVGTINGGATQVFTLTVNNAGEYVFTLLKPLDHAVGNDPLFLNFGVKITDFDTDSAVANIQIKVVDSVPEFPPPPPPPPPENPDPSNPAVGKGYEVVDDTNLGPNVVSGTVQVKYGLDVPGTLNANGTTSSSVPLKSAGQNVTISVDANGNYVGTIDGGATTVFTLTLQDNGGYTFTQIKPIDHPDATNPDDAIRVTFGIKATDFDGDVANSNIIIDIKDDGPVAVDDGKTVLQNTLVVNGNVTDNDDVGADVNGSVINVRFNGVDHPVAGPTIVVGQYGTLTINPNGSYQYTSFGTNNVEVQDKFTYTLRDFDGDTDTADLTITIQDVDYRPELATPKPLTVDETDLNPTDTDGNVVTANFFGDGPGTYTPTGTGTFSYSGHAGGSLTSNGVPVVVTLEGDTYVGKANGATIFTLEINQTTGAYDFVLQGVLDHADKTNPNDVIKLNFGVTATDADGDAVTGNIVVNVLDDGPKANPDCNEFVAKAVDKDFNIVLVLDVSGSMAGERIALLKSSVANLLGEFNGYNGGDIKVHIVPFATSAQTGQTFTVTDDASYQAALNFVNGMNADGFTNYESPLSSAISWLNGASANDPIPGADTYSYFLTDGEPNRYVNGGGGTSTGDANQVMGEITGSDGSNEVQTLKNLSTEVIAVGLAVDGVTLDRLDIIDSNGDALDVQNPQDLNAALLATNPIFTGSTFGNVITGLNGGAGAADNLSKDVINTVTKVKFGATEVVVHPVNGADINGANGKLHINADGSYTYTLFSPAPNQPVNGKLTDQFTYTLTDRDGDPSDSTLTLKATIPDDPVDAHITVNNGVDDVKVKEDGQIGVPISASYTGGDGDEVVKLTLTGVNTSWTVTAPGWTNNGGGNWSITLPAGQKTYNGNFTFKPPANSDVDLNGLVAKITVTDPDTVGTKEATDGFRIIVDAVADVPTLNVTLPQQNNYDPGRWTFSNYYNYLYWGAKVSGAFTMTSAVTDTDGSEKIAYYTIEMPKKLDDFGVTFSKGTEISPGVWKVMAGDEVGLQLVFPEIPKVNGVYWENPDYMIPEGIHNFKVTVYNVEAVLSGVEYDTSDNTNSATKTVKVVIFSSPLVIDLDNDGLDVVGADQGVYFDINGDGTLDKTGWVSSKDGLLALDKNHNGLIDNQKELFGGSTEDGFTVLANYDSNHDGKIDSADAVWGELKIWQDLNQDGISQADELLGLDAHGIKSISLNAQASDQFVNGNGVSAESVVTKTDGSETKISDVWFEFYNGADAEQVAAGEAAHVGNVLYGTDGDDTFLFSADHQGVDTINDFEAGKDVIDVSALLDGFDALQDSIDDFVFSREVNGNTIISVDADGTGAGGAVDVAVLQAVTGLELNDIIDLTTNKTQTTV